MGLFSLFGKNKQETTKEDSGYYTAADDDAVGARARSKRASSAGEPAAKRGKSRQENDPVLPEKKRARRRLVGAIALALAVAVGLPMLLDSEPKPLATDIAIQIPSKDKVAPLPQPARASAGEALDQREEIVDMPANKPVTAAASKPPVPAPVTPAVTPAPTQNTVADVKPVTAPKEPAKPDTHPVAKPDAKPDAKLEAKLEAKAPAKASAKAEEKAHAAKPEGDDAARALAILDGKPETAPAPAADAPVAHSRFVVQVAAMASQEKATELQNKLKEAGIKSYTQKAEGLIKVRVGPFGSKEEAEKARAKLGELGLKGNLVAS